MSALTTLQTIAVITKLVQILLGATLVNVTLDTIKPITHARVSFSSKILLYSIQCIHY